MDEILVVAAIDFGTSFSGYAYSFRKNPDQILINQKWNNGNEEEQSVAYKTPTTVLYDDKGNFNSFGYEAEDRFAVKREANQEKGWRYFRHFKMKLHQALDTSNMASNKRKGARVSRCLKLHDQYGQEMDAIKVFSDAIGYLKTTLLKTLKDSTGFTRDNDVLWVLTVPSIWGLQAKQFMREAAVNAGIHGRNLRLALEPEAAAIYCKSHEMQKEQVESTMLAFQPGESFMIIDCGGGTVDITVHTVEEDGSLKEMCLPSGGPWGGTSVDDKFFDFMKELIGVKTFEKIQTLYPSTMFDLQRAFETKKKNALNPDGCSITGGISQVLHIFKKETKKDLEKSIPKKFSNSVGITLGSRLRLSKTLMTSFFESPLQSISDHVVHLFQNTQIEHINKVLLVGGFSDSPLLKTKLEEVFPSKQFILPRDASLAVLKGAVLYGHNQRSITTRISHATYGIATDVPFDKTVHPESHLHTRRGVSLCTDVFKVMITRNQPLTIDTTFTNEFRPPNAEDVTADIEVFSSSQKDPKYTTDPECQRIGVMTIEIPDTRKGKDRLIQVRMHFGGTELYVTAVENGTENTVSATFDCLK
ncbi:hypothetical protein FSP39_003052 [Pinctada imbricata]|uniref:Uncharacterized protein n=1 Tax=Pinctada imbricata TaxID=66713 RepID=A0AA89BYH8_PINIB|nr:hypothetical protein FSP39_003052 [Pinctada imbricata]